MEDDVELIEPESLFLSNNRIAVGSDETKPPQLINNLAPSVIQGFAGLYKPVTQPAINTKSIKDNSKHVVNSGDSSSQILRGAVVLDPISSFLKESSSSVMTSKRKHNIIESVESENVDFAIERSPQTKKPRRTGRMSTSLKHGSSAKCLLMKSDICVNKSEFIINNEYDEVSVPIVNHLDDQEKRVFPITDKPSIVDQPYNNEVPMETTKIQIGKNLDSDKVLTKYNKATSHVKSEQISSKILNEHISFKKNGHSIKDIIPANGQGKLESETINSIESTQSILLSEKSKSKIVRFSSDLVRGDFPFDNRESKVNVKQFNIKPCKIVVLDIQTIMDIKNISVANLEYLSIYCNRKSKSRQSCQNLNFPCTYPESSKIATVTTLNTQAPIEENTASMLTKSQSTIISGSDEDILPSTNHMVSADLLKDIPVTNYNEIENLSCQTVNDDDVIYVNHLKNKTIQPLSVESICIDDADTADIVTEPITSTVPVHPSLRYMLTKESCGCSSLYCSHNTSDQIQLISETKVLPLDLQLSVKTQVTSLFSETYQNLKVERTLGNADKPIEIEDTCCISDIKKTNKHLLSGDKILQPYNKKYVIKSSRPSLLKSPVKTKRSLLSNVINKSKLQNHFSLYVNNTVEISDSDTVCSHCTSDDNDELVSNIVHIPSDTDDEVIPTSQNNFLDKPKKVESFQESILFSPIKPEVDLKPILPCSKEMHVTQSNLKRQILPTFIKCSKETNELKEKTGLIKSVSIKQIRKLSERFNLKKLNLTVIKLSKVTIDRIIQLCTVKGNWHDKDMLTKAGMTLYDIIRLGVRTTRRDLGKAKYGFRRIIYKKRDVFQSTLEKPKYKKSNKMNQQLEFLKSSDKKKKDLIKAKQKEELEKKTLESIRRSLLKINARFLNQNKFWSSI